jgi:hypothetical protein
MRRNRRINSTIIVDPSTGEEKMILHFYVEGKSRDDHSGESWWTSAKRWIQPIVFERSDGQPLEPAPEPTPKSEPEEQSWFSYFFGALMPSTYRRGTGSSMPVFHRPAKPELGKYTTGEAVATLTRVRLVSGSPHPGPLSHRAFSHRMKVASSTFKKCTSTYRQSHGRTSDRGLSRLSTKAAERHPINKLDRPAIDWCMAARRREVEKQKKNSMCTIFRPYATNYMCRITRDWQRMFRHSSFRLSTGRSTPLAAPG